MSCQQQNNNNENKYKDIISVVGKNFFEKRYFSNFQKQPPEVFLKIVHLRTNASELQRQVLQPQPHIICVFPVGWTLFF